MAITVSLLDPEETGARFDAALAVWRTAVAEYDPAKTPDTAEGFRGTMRGNDTFEKRQLVAELDGVVVGIGRVNLWHIEGDEHRAEVIADVDPRVRRQGVGSAIVRHALEICRKEGRTLITAWGVESEANKGFWEGHMGAAQGLTERHSRVWMADVDAELMDRWIADRNDRAADYRLVFVAGPTPRELLPAYAALLTATNDAPWEDLEAAEDNWTPETVAALDEYQRGAGIERLGLLAFDATGEPAGLTAVYLSGEKPEFGVQADTVVVATHRQRGLGRWLKAKMWRYLRAERPALRALDTGNAASNDPMLAINHAMGFEPIFNNGHWQRETDAFLAALG